MLVEIFSVVLVLAVAALMVVDLLRTRNESAHEQAHQSERTTTGASRQTGFDPLPREPAGTGITATGITATGHDARRRWRPEGNNSSAGGHQDSRTGPSEVHKGSRRELKNWHVRSRLLLLVIIPAVAGAAAAFCVVHIAGALQGAPIHSTVGSVRDGAIQSALAAGAVMIIVLALASWSTIVAARSVLEPLRRLRVGALEVAGARLPDAVRRISENNGAAGPSDVEPIDMDSSDEIGEIARAFDQIRTELLRLAANETALHVKLDTMFVNLSHRSQSLVERQIRLIENLEQREQDKERLANLSSINRIATRIYRNSQNLLVLAGHELPTGRNQPVALVNLIRAAVSEIVEFERVSLNAQPDIAVCGPAVSDVVHLLAELIENATSFSAADMPVDISGHLLTTGGVLIDITDRGVGMAEKEMAYANWRLENPPTASTSVPKWMGLFVVARLAARHGIGVRFRQAQFGGLTALVWLPDEVIAYLGAAASPRPSGFGRAGSRAGLHEAAVDPGRATAEQRATTARSTEFAPVREDLQDAPVGWRPEFQAEPAGTGQVSGIGLSASGQRETSQFASTPVRAAAPSGQETTSADGGVVVWPPDDLEEPRRLPIYDAVESNWFRGGREAPGGTAAAGSRWSSPADEGSHAAETVDSPSSGGSTTAGLPKRLPNANLVPGAIPSTQPVAPPKRSPAAARDRLAGFQRGVSEGRAVASEVTSPGGEDES